MQTQVVDLFDLSKYPNAAFDIGTGVNLALSASVKLTTMLENCQLLSLLELLYGRSADIAPFAGMGAKLMTQVGMYAYCQQMGCTANSAIIEEGNKLWTALSNKDHFGTGLYMMLIIGEVTTFQPNAYNLGNTGA